MKASWLAFASLVSIGSAEAGEISSPPNATKIGETAISRMYRVAWLANFGRRQEDIRPAVNYRTQVLATSNAESAAREGAAAAKAAVDARIQTIAAEVDVDMRKLAQGRPLRYKLHVDCSSKFLQAAAPPDGPAPAVLTAFGDDVKSVKVSVESCTVKVLWKFLDGKGDGNADGNVDHRDGAPHMRAYSVSVPLQTAAE